MLLRNDIATLKAEITRLKRDPAAAHGELHQSEMQGRSTSASATIAGSGARSGPERVSNLDKRG